MQLPQSAVVRAHGSVIVDPTGELQRRGLGENSVAMNCHRPARFAAELPRRPQDSRTNRSGRVAAHVQVAGDHQFGAAGQFEDGRRRRPRRRGDHHVTPDP